jgi:hypothetical protein
LPAQPHGPKDKHIDSLVNLLNHVSTRFPSDLLRVISPIFTHFDPMMIWFCRLWVVR